MNKVANQKQILLCKQAAMERYAQLGIPAELGVQLFDMTLNKLAQLTNSGAPFAGTRESGYSPNPNFNGPYEQTMKPISTKGSGPVPTPPPKPTLKIPATKTAQGIPNDEQFTGPTVGNARAEEPGFVGGVYKGMRGVSAGMNGVTGALDKLFGAPLTIDDGLATQAPGGLAKYQQLPSSQQVRSAATPKPAGIRAATPAKK